MTIIVYLLFVSILFNSQKTASANQVAVSPTTIDPLTDQNIIDEPWIGHMIVAPATINLLGQVMVVSSTVDVSFETYSPGHVYKYIRYPKSLRATLLQVSNEGYRAFLGAHSSMNKIQAYMKQIPQHMETVKKIAESKASSKLVSRMLPRSVNNIERIGNTCVALAQGAEKSFVSVLDLIGEVLEIVKVTQGGYEADRTRGRIELNVTRDIHADMKRAEEERRKHFEEIRETVRKAQREYSQALRDIPTGFKALALDLGRAVIKVVSAFGQSFAASTTGGSVMGQGQGSGASQGQSFSTGQILNFASRFANSLDELIQKLSKPADQPSVQNGNQTISKTTAQTRNSKELEGYKVLFGSLRNMVNIFPQNNLKSKATNLIQRGIALVDKAMKDKNADITDELQTLANEVRPFMAAEQISNPGSAPISVPSSGDSSNNELLKARLAQENLARQEQRVDAYYTAHIAAMDQIRQVTEKLARLNLQDIHFTQIIEMLEEAFELLAQLQQNWSNLVLFFSGFANQVVTGFGEKLKTFIGTANSPMDAEASDTDRKVILGFLKDDSYNLYHESYVLYVLSRTYYDVSSKYLMPRLSGLSSMLAAKNDQERKILLVQLKEDTEDVQNKVKQLIEERRAMFKKAVNEKRAQITEVIDEQGADGNEDEIIEEAKLLGLE